MRPGQRARAPLRRISDRRLLSFAWGGAAAMLAIGVLLGAQAERGYRRQTARQVEAQADILAASVGAALAFDDRKAMAEYVDALRVNRRLAWPVAQIRRILGGP